jgi:hypothetical protein
MVEHIKHVTLLQMENIARGNMSCVFMLLGAWTAHDAM